MYSWYNFEKCAIFKFTFQLLRYSIKKTTGFYLQTETMFFLFFVDLMNYKEVLKLQASFFE